MQVKTFDEKKIKKLIKDGDPLIKQYIKAKDNIINMQKISFLDLKVKYLSLYNDHQRLKLESGKFDDIIVGNKL